MKTKKLRSLKDAVILLAIEADAIVDTLNDEIERRCQSRQSKDARKAAKKALRAAEAEGIRERLAEMADQFRVDEPLDEVLANFEQAEKGTTAPPRPTPGRIVHYRLTAADAEKINRRHADTQRNIEIHRTGATGVQVHVGNGHQAGDIVPLLVVRVWDDEYLYNVDFDMGVWRDSPAPEPFEPANWPVPDSPYGINGQAFIDGNDVLWVCSAPQGDANGFWQWPERV